MQDQVEKSAFQSKAFAKASQSKSGVKSFILGLADSIKYLPR